MKQTSIIILLFVGFILYVESKDTDVLDSGNSLKKKPPCPMIKCMARDCPYGRVIDENGCNTCECNPCKFGQPDYVHLCGDYDNGYRKCEPRYGTCKDSEYGNKYCCPEEDPGECPAYLLQIKMMCRDPNCETDFDCPIKQKCCSPCARCVRIDKQQSDVIKKLFN